MAYTKRCPRCARPMRTKQDNAWYECSCGNAWVKGRGHFTKTPDMTIAKKVLQVGDISTNVIEITSSIPDTPPQIYALGPSQEGGSVLETTPQESEADRQKRIAAYEQRNGTNLVRGGIYYIKKHLSEGSEIHSGRPGIIVSKQPYSSGLHNLVSVVYLTTRVKRPSPTRVPITSSGTDATALCESITTIDVTKVSDLIGVCTEDEMAAVKNALAIYLDIHIDSGLDTDSNHHIRIANLESEISALEDQLRECVQQLHNKYPGCSCCAGDKPIQWQDERNYVTIDSAGVMDIMIQGNQMTIKVNKCPVCGRWFSLAKHDAGKK